nr:hypothetical protein [Halorubrum sp. SS7]
MSQATLGSGPYRNSSLFSGYYLDERVADLDAWDCDAEAEEAFEQIRDLWNREGALLPSYKEDELIDTWIAEVLDILGYGTSSEVTLPDGGGYVDRLLFENKDVRRESARQALDSGTEGHFSRALSILEAKQWDADFEKFFSEQRSYRDASHQIKFYLERTPGDLNWGILTDGKKWRLYGTKDYETQTYYEVDLPEILESGNLEAFKYFYVFFRPGAFVETAGSSFLDDVWSESETWRGPPRQRVPSAAGPRKGVRRVERSGNRSQRRGRTQRRRTERAVAGAALPVDVRPLRRVAGADRPRRPGRQRGISGVLQPRSETRGDTRRGRRA